MKGRRLRADRVEQQRGGDHLPCMMCLMPLMDWLELHLKLKSRNQKLEWDCHVHELTVAGFKEKVLAFLLTSLEKTRVGLPRAGRDHALHN